MVQRLHSIGVVHRNIHPGNIMHLQRWRMVLWDYDLAEQVTNPVSSRQCGTNGYRLSEQDTCYDVYKADVYAALRTVEYYYDRLVSNLCTSSPVIATARTECRDEDVPCDTSSPVH
jgi:serine/threonine protein kinase